jgi:hypothetical protein
VGAHHPAMQGEGRKPSSRSRPSLLGSKAAIINQSGRLNRRARKQNPLEFSRLFPETKGPISLRSDNEKSFPWRPHSSSEVDATVSYGGAGT